MKIDTHPLQNNRNTGKLNRYDLASSEKSSLRLALILSSAASIAGCGEKSIQVRLNVLEATNAPSWRRAEGWRACERNSSTDEAGLDRLLSNNSKVVTANKWKVNIEHKAEHNTFNWTTTCFGMSYIIEGPESELMIFNNNFVP